MKCDICKNYVYHSPTWQDPTYDEYCKIYGDFENVDICKHFEMSRWAQLRAIKNRTLKLERILYGKED